MIAIVWSISKDDSSQSSPKRVLEGHRGYVNCLG